MGHTYAPQVTVAEWMAVRERIAEELKQGSPQSQLPTRIRQAELLLTAGLIDVEQILRGNVEVDEDVIIPGTWVEAKPSIDPGADRPVGVVVGTTGYSLWIRWFGNPGSAATAIEHPLEDMQRKTDRSSDEPVEKLAAELGISKPETKSFVETVEKLAPEPDDLPKESDTPGMAFFPGDDVVVVSEGPHVGKRGKVVYSASHASPTDVNVKVQFREEDGGSRRIIAKSSLALS